MDELLIPPVREPVPMPGLKDPYSYYGRTKRSEKDHLSSELLKDKRYDVDNTPTTNLRLYRKEGREGRKR